MLTMILPDSAWSFMVDLADIKFVGPAWPEDKRDLAFFQIAYYSGGEQRLTFSYTGTMREARAALVEALMKYQSKKVTEEKTFYFMPNSGLCPCPFKTMLEFLSLESLTKEINKTDTLLNDGRLIENIGNLTDAVRIVETLSFYTVTVRDKTGTLRRIGTIDGFGSSAEVKAFGFTFTNL